MPSTRWHPSASPAPLHSRTQPGTHLILVGYMAYSSGFVPRFLAALVCLSGAGYAFDSIASVLWSGASLSGSAVLRLLMLRNP